MKNILLVGEWKSPNLGDSVLCNCVYKYLEKHLPHHNLIKFDLSFGYNPTKFQYWLYFKIVRLLNLYNRLLYRDMSNSTSVLSRLRSKLFIRQIKNLSSLDCIIFCGGQIFLDYFIYCILEIVKYAEIKKIPVIWNACGGSDLPDIASKIVQRCINSSMTQAISVRDNIDFFKRFNPNVSLIPDTAILVSECYSYSPRQSNLIGLGVMSYELINERLSGTISKDKIICFWRELITKLEKVNLNWQFFTNGDPGDYQSAKILLKELGYDSYHLHICERPRTDTELVNLISKFDAIVSFRLHSHIIAYSLGIQSYGLAWDKKVIDFFSLTNRNMYCSALGDFNSEKVYEFISNYKKQTLANSLIAVVKEHMNNDIINKI